MALKEINSDRDAILCLLGMGRYEYQAKEVDLLNSSNKEEAKSFAEKILYTVDDSEISQILWGVAITGPFGMVRAKKFAKSNNSPVKVEILKVIISHLTDDYKAKLPQDILINSLKLNSEEMTSLFLGCRKDQTFTKAMLATPRYIEIIKEQLNDYGFKPAPLLLETIYTIDPVVFNDIVSEFTKSEATDGLFAKICAKDEDINNFLFTFFKATPEMCTLFISYLYYADKLDFINYDESHQQYILKHASDEIKQHLRTLVTASDLGSNKYGEEEPEEDLENGLLAEEPPQNPASQTDEEFDETIKEIMGATDKRLFSRGTTEDEVETAIKQRLNNVEDERVLNSLKRISQNPENIDKCYATYGTYTKISIVLALLKLISSPELKKEVLQSVVINSSFLYATEVEKLYLDRLNIDDESHIEIGAALLATSFKKDVRNKLTQDTNYRENCHYLIRATNYLPSDVISNWIEDMVINGSPVEKDNLFGNMSYAESNVFDKKDRIYFIHLMKQQGQAVEEYIDYLVRENKLDFNQLDINDKLCILSNASDETAKNIFRALSIKEQANISSRANTAVSTRLRSFLTDEEMDKIIRYMSCTGERNMWTNVLGGVDSSNTATNIMHFVGGYIEAERLQDGLNQSIANPDNIVAFNKLSEETKINIIKGVTTSMMPPENITYVFNTFKEKNMIDLNLMIKLIFSLKYELSSARRGVKAVFDSDFGDDLKATITSYLTSSNLTTCQETMDLLNRLRRDALDAETISEIVNSVDKAKEETLFTNIVSIGDPYINSYIVLFTGDKRSTYIEYLHKNNRLDFSSKPKEIQNIIYEAASKEIKEELINTLPNDKKVEKMREMRTEEVNNRIKELLNHDYSSSEYDIGPFIIDLTRNGHIDIFIEQFKECLKDPNLVTAFKRNAGSEFKAKTVNKIITNLPGTAPGNQFLDACEEKTLLEAADLVTIFGKYNVRNPIERLYAKQLLTSRCGNRLIDNIKINATKVDSTREAVELLGNLLEINRDFKAANYNIITNTIDRMDALVAENLFKNIVKYGLITAFIDKFPDNIKQKYIDYLHKEKKLDLGSLTTKQKIDVIDAASTNTKRELVGRLKPEEKQEIIRELTSTNDIKELFDSTLKRTGKIKDEIDKIKDAKNKSGFGAAIDIKKKEWRVNKLRKKAKKNMEALIKMKGFPSADDRLDFIDKIKLKKLQEAATRFERYNTELETAEKELHDAIAERERQLEIIEQSKANINAQKAAIARSLEQYKPKIKKIGTDKYQTYIELLKNRETTHDDKLGKFTDKATIEQAWALILANGGIPTASDIESIITSKQYELGVVKEEDLKSLIATMQTALEAMKRGAIHGENEMGYEEEIQEAMEEAAGMHLGMSNFVMIIGVVALTVSILAIILTIIMS